MTRHNEALEQMRSANPLPGIDHVNADELVLSRSHFDERRLAMTTRTPTPQDLSRTRQRRSQHPALVAATAFILVGAVLGVGTVLLRGNESTVTEESGPAVTTIPPATTVPAEPAVIAPEEPTIESGVRVLSDVPEYGMNLAVDADGLPMLWSTTRVGDEYPGTARLFRCVDNACNEFTVEELAYTSDTEPLVLGGDAVSDSVIVGPNGDAYITLASTTAMHSIGRYDGGVVEPLPVLGNWPHSQPPVDPGGPMPFTPLPAAFDEAGNPVFVVFHGEYPATVNLLVCNDPLCGDFFEVEFDSGTFHDQFSEVSIEGDVATVVYSIGEPTEPLHSEEIGMTARVHEVMIATINDLYGSPIVSTTVIYESLNGYLTDVDLVDGGEPVAWVWHWQETETPGEPSLSATEIACADVQCSEVTMTEYANVDPSLMGELDPQMRPVSAYAETIYDPVEYGAYIEEERRIAEEGLDLGAKEPEVLGTNVVVAQCVDRACTSAERTTIATGEAPWWYLDSLSLEVAADGTILVAMAVSEESSEGPGLRLFVFPEGDLGPGVDPIVGFADPGVWPAS